MYVNSQIIIKNIKKKLSRNEALPEKDVINLFTYKGSKAEELPVNTM